MPELKKPHLLIIEDDPAIAHLLRALLKHGGMTADVVRAPVPALHRAAAEYVAILMDADLSYEEGFQKIQQLRVQSSMPLIVISGRCSEHDKIRALDAGADDFLVKPFFPGELLARIRALLRRHAVAASQ